MVAERPVPCWGSDSVAVASGALAVAGDDGDGMNHRILLVASAPLDGGVEEVPVGVDQRSGVAVVEVPSCAAVVGDIASSAGDQAADGAFDAAADVAVDPHILQQQVVGVDVGVDAVGVVVVGGRAAGQVEGTAGLPKAMHCEWRVTSRHSTSTNFAPVRLSGIGDAEAAEDLGELGAVGDAAAAAGGVVLAEDAGVLGAVPAGMGGLKQPKLPPPPKHQV